MAMLKLRLGKSESNKSIFNKYAKELKKLKTKWGQKEIESYLWRKEIKNPNLSSALYYHFKNIDGKKELKKQGDIQNKIKKAAKT